MPIVFDIEPIRAVRPPELVWLTLAELLPYGQTKRFAQCFIGPAPPHSRSTLGNLGLAGWLAMAQLEGLFFVHAFAHRSNRKGGE